MRQIASQKVPSIEVYERAQGDWHWRLRSCDGWIFVESGQGYGSEASCRHGADMVKQTVYARFAKQQSPQSLPRH
jgi:uncharacterized protein YegP (UPF0339 family)